MISLDFTNKGCLRNAQFEFLFVCFLCFSYGTCIDCLNLEFHKNCDIGCGVIETFLVVPVLGQYF